MVMESTRDKVPINGANEKFCNYWGVFMLRNLTYLTKYLNQINAADRIIGFCFTVLVKFCSIGNIDLF